jgi:chromosome partitioning protein
METIAILNLKGGVGKTTVAINLAAGLGYMGKRILIIDSDPQCSLTHFFGLEPITRKGFEYFLTGDFSFENLYYQYNKFLHIMPAGRKLKDLELSITQKYNQKKWLWHALTKVAFLNVKDQYDYIIFDCPANAGLLNINTLNYVKNVFIPVQCQYLSLQGLKKTIFFIKKIKRFYNPAINNPLVIPTMFDRRDSHSLVISNNLKQLISGSISKTIIRYNVSLSQTAIYNKTIFDYKPKSRGADDFKRLAKEITRLLLKQKKEPAPIDMQYQSGKIAEYQENFVHIIEKVDEMVNHLP